MTSSNYQINAEGIRKIYESMLKLGENKERRDALVKELLSKQREDGSWSVIDTRMCDSDIRVYYIYFPTYYATAALMYADLCENYSPEGKEKQALLRGLEAASERKLMGHGFDATRQMLDTFAIYKKAGLYRWMKKEENARILFCDVIHERIAVMRDDIKRGRTFSDWDVDFKAEYEREIVDYSEIDEPYVWYACYGSNINRNRFMRYINDCSDTTPPVEDRPFRFKYNVYFAKSARNWHNGGKAFLDDTTVGEAYGRIYKIKQSQFEEIKRAEGYDYTKRLNLGTVQGIPVYSFTDLEKNEASKVPSDEYYKTILDGLTECYEGIFDANELNAYLISRIFPKNAFVVAKTIKQSPRFMTNAEISAATSLFGDDFVDSISWLLERKVIKQDSRSVRAGHRPNDPEAYFYTVDGRCGRGLLVEIMKNL